MKTILHYNQFTASSITLDNILRSLWFNSFNPHNQQETVRLLSPFDRLKEKREKKTNQPNQNHLGHEDLE